MERFYCIPWHTLNNYFSCQSKILLPCTSSDTFTHSSNTIILGNSESNIMVIMLQPYLVKGVVTNYGEGGATKREGGTREVLPLRKGGAEKVLAILKGGHKKFWGRFYAVA